MEPVALVVEDDADLRELLEWVIRREGYVVHVASNVGEARALALPSVDVLVSDFALVDGDGTDVLAAFATRRPRVSILLTGYDPRRLPQSTFDHVFMKPVAMDELLAAIRTPS